MRKPAPKGTQRRKKYQFSVIVVREKRAYWAYVPDLPGVYGRGHTAASAKKDISAALTLYVEDCIASGEPIPYSAAQVVNVDTLSLALGA
jgi:predicted RNase H-like HicB family nuclease